MPTRRYVKIAAQNPPAADLQRLKLIQGSVGLAKRGHDGLQLVCPKSRQHAWGGGARHRAQCQPRSRTRWGAVTDLADARGPGVGGKRSDEPGRASARPAPDVPGHPYDRRRHAGVLGVRTASDGGARRANLDRCLSASSRSSGIKVCLCVNIAKARGHIPPKPIPPATAQTDAAGTRFPPRAADRCSAF